MAKDDRLYGKFTLDFPDHAKILPLSDAAFRCLVEATLYSRKHLTDGFLARRYAVARWSLEVLRELCENDHEHPSLIESEDGWRIHDFAEMQDTRAEVEARRERNRMAGRQGGLAKANRTAKRTAKRTASKSVSENLAETETKTEVELTTDVVSSIPRKRGKRLPEDWMPPQSVIDTIKAELGATSEELTYQHRKFVDFWTSKAGANATKLDWSAAWRNWMRSAAERGQIGQSKPGVAKPNKLRALADLAAEVRQMEINADGKALEA